MKFLVVAVAFLSLLSLGTYIFLYKWLGEERKRIAWLSVGVNVIAMISLGVSFTTLQGKDYAGWIIQGVSIWMMIEIITLAVALLLSLVYKVSQVISQKPVDQSKRKLVKVLSAAPVVATGMSLYGSFAERKHTIVREQILKIDNLGERLQGYRIAQISDVHIGPFYDMADLRRLLEQVVATKADLLAITGDLFDDVKLNFQAGKIVNEYCHRFPQGIYYCHGNHEHIRGIGAIEMALDNTDIHKLVNENSLVLEDSRPLYLAGVDYPMVRQDFSYLQSKFTEKAMENIPSNAVKILLAHHPDFIDTAAEYQADLVLTGHTHGGQLGILGIPMVPPVFKYMRGTYHIKNTTGYVHTGNGSWFPLRIGCPPEIAIFQLRNK